MMTTAGSLALQGSIAERDAFVVGAVARRRRGDPRQDQSQRVGELPLDQIDERLERTRRAGEESLRARPQSVRIELGHRRRDRGESRGGRRRDGNRRIHRLPVRRQRLVGIKPTVGLVSRAGIIPISRTQDTAGPMARTVADAAILLGAMTGVDWRDRATAAAVGRAGDDYTAALEADGLQGGANRRRPEEVLRLQPRRRRADRWRDRGDEEAGRGDRRSGGHSDRRAARRRASSRCCCTSSRRISTPTWPDETRRRRSTRCRS